MEIEGEIPHIISNVELTPDQTMQLQKQLEALLCPEQIDADQAEIDRIRTESCDALASAISEPTKAEAVADLLVDELEAAEGVDPLIKLYCSWGVIKRAQAMDPDLKLPKKFLTHISDMAREQDETDIVFGIMALDLRDTVPLEDQESSETTPSVNEPSLLLGDLVSRSQNALLALTTPEHSADQARLEQYGDDPDRLLTALNRGEFKTTEGAEAAKARQDQARLEKYSDDPTKLLAALNRGEFKTTEGAEAAKARQDQARLEKYSDDPHRLLASIREGLFTTTEGAEAAKARQDQARLEKYSDDPAQLLAAIREGLFTTTEGAEAARRLLGID